MFPRPLQVKLDTPDVAPQVNALTRHLQHCRQASGPMFVAASWAERAHSQLAPRFVTTVAVAALVLAALCAWA